MDKYVLMPMRYLVYGIISLFSAILTWFLSPLLSLVSMFTKDGNLPKGLKWFQTHDAPLSQGWIQGYFQLKKEDGSYKFGSKAVAEWFYKMRWLQRNSAYDFRHNILGYQDIGSVDEYYKIVGNSRLPVKHYEIVLVKNPNSNAWNRYAFMFKGHFFYTKKRYVRMFLGWKVTRKDADGKRMVVTSINPFRTWNK